MSYQYVIVGAGPVGLTLAWLLSQSPKTGPNGILIIEREHSIGGCHRVRRHQNFFTEHGPRVYSNIYLNTIQILNEMEIPFNKVFTPYNFSNNSMSSIIISKLSIRENLLLMLEYFKLALNPLHGQNTSVADFITANNYSNDSRDLLNRVCRLTDGASIDRYTLFELLSGFDQHVFYQFAQPRRPNDVYLFSMWRTKLEATGKVEFLLNTMVNKVNMEINSNIANHHNKVTGVNIHNGNGSYDILAPTVILAIPPKPVAKILRGLSWNGRNLDQFAKASEYETNIPVVFHWNKKLVLPKIWGFPSSEWGVISILLSDYTQFDDSRSQTVISTCITLTDTVSSVTHKTANQTTKKQELIDEVFRQLSHLYGGLPTPTIAILSPDIYRDAGGKWVGSDTAFVLTPESGFIADQSHRGIKGLHWVGTHNGKSYYHFTSMESAVTNAMAFCNRELHKPLNLSKIVRYLIATICVILLCVVYFRYKNK